MSIILFVSLCCRQPTIATICSLNATIFQCVNLCCSALIFDQLKSHFLWKIYFYTKYFVVYMLAQNGFFSFSFNFFRSNIRCVSRQVALLSQRGVRCFVSVSIVSCNSAILRAQSSIVSYFGFRFTAAYKQILLFFLLFVVIVHAAVKNKIH